MMTTGTWWATAGGLAAATAATRQAALEGALWLGGTVLVLSAAAVVVAMIRRRLGPKAPASFGSFTLADLRRMRDRGDVSPGEYEALLRRNFVQSGARDKDRRSLSDKNLQNGPAGCR